MPVELGYTTKKGRRCGFYRWGKSGKKYLFKIGSEQSRKAAHEKAAIQGRAVEWRRHQ
jgi:hypothetical protein